MNRKGYDFKPAHHLYCRDADPTRDTDYRGRPIQSNYVTVVRFADCVDADGSFSCDLHGAAPSAVNGWHARTNMIFSETWRHHKRRKMMWLPVKMVSDAAARGAVFQVRRKEGDDVLVSTDEYFTAPIYWVEDDKVFRSTRYRLVRPER